MSAAACAAPARDASAPAGDAPARAAAAGGDASAVVALATQAARHVERGRPVEALRALRRAREQAAALGRDDAHAEVLVVLGELYTSTADFDRARSYFQESLARAERARDSARTARALNGLARLDLHATRYASAAERLERARLAAAGSAALADTLRLLSELRARLGDLATAQRLAAESHGPAAGRLPLGEARAVAQRARVAARAASYREALEAWEAALGRFRTLGALPDAVDALMSLGDLHDQLGVTGESKPRYEAALVLFREIGDGAGEARALVRLARVERRLGRPELALAHADAALALARRRHDYVTEAEALVELGEIWTGQPVARMPNLPNPEVARRHLRAAREIYKDAGDRGAGAGVWLRTGAILLRARQYVTAARVFEFVVRTARELDDEDLLWQALRGEAATLAGQGAFGAAAGRYEAAIAVLERVYARTAGLGQEARASFLGDRRGIYEEYVDVLIRLRRQGGGPELEAAAFAAAEQAKSRQFAEMVAAGGVERLAVTGDPRLRELLADERSLRADLAQVTSALAGPGGRSAQAGDLAGRAAALRRAHDDVVSRLEAEFPRHAELLRPRPVAVADVQAVVQPGEALVSYFVGPAATVVFVVTRDRLVMRPIDASRRELRALADRFRRPFASVSSLGDLAKWDPAPAHGLYARLVAPIAPALPADATLLVAGDDVLYTVPFEAFLRRPPPPLDASRRPLFADLAGLDWLGDAHPIAYVPSAAALRALRGDRGAARWQAALVAFADPDFGEGGGAALRWVARSGTAALARLPETADEARAVSAILGGTSHIFLRADAAETRLGDPQLASARVVMFSTHGLLGGEVSAVVEPALALAQVGNPPGVDGFLSMSEVLGLRLAADLVVLSACNTAGEPDAARLGEGFAGLTRSFMYAGARSLVVSHWPVGSRATVTLMTAFFDELRTGVSKPRALAAARRRLRGVADGGVALAHPFFWAPFVVVGEPR